MKSLLKDVVPAGKIVHSFLVTGWGVSFDAKITSKLTNPGGRGPPPGETLVGLYLQRVSGWDSLRLDQLAENYSATCQ
jgi:hypothetical protein